MSALLELKSTLNLPKTGFAMKANLTENEPKRLERWRAMDLYAKIRDVHKNDPTYILHDGPPYANGPIHLGTALNKCLKDFVVKSKTMAGFDAPYVPGWDCHGLPIEIKVDEALGRKKLEMKPLDVGAPVPLNDKPKVPAWVRGTEGALAGGIAIGIVGVGLGGKFLFDDGKPLCSVAPSQEQCSRIAHTQALGVGLVVAGSALALGAGAALAYVELKVARPGAIASQSVKYLGR